MTKKLNVKVAVANAAARLSETATKDHTKSFSEIFEELLDKYDVTSPLQLDDHADKQNFYRELEERTYGLSKDAQNLPTTQSKETASTINYNKDELVLINEGKSWNNPVFKVGRVTRVGDNVCGCYPDGNKFSFKPTKSGVGIVGRWRGDFTDTIEYSMLKDGLEESSPFYGKPFGSGENPFFPTNRPNQTMEVSEEESEDDLPQQEVSFVIDHASVMLELTCPRCSVKQVWASNGYCKSCGNFYGFPHANPAGYYDSSVPVVEQASVAPPFVNVTGNVPSTFLQQAQLSSCGQLTEMLTKLLKESQDDTPVLFERISKKLDSIRMEYLDVLTVEDYEKLQAVYSILYSIEETKR